MKRGCEPSFAVAAQLMQAIDGERRRFLAKKLFWDEAALFLSSVGSREDLDYPDWHVATRLACQHAAASMQ